jgi:glycosyltransferase involved in cell wall biosynthesis
MTRVLHVVTVEWSSTEGIARACRELAREMHDVDSYLVATREPGSCGAAFAGVRVVPAWSPLVPFHPEFALAVRDFAPDIVHIHGGTLAPTMACAPSLKGLPVVVTCYAPAGIPRALSLAPKSLREHRVNFSLSRVAASAGGGLALSRWALRSGRVGAVCTPDPRVEASFTADGPVVIATGGGRPTAERAEWSSTPTVVFAGRAQSGRGVDDLITAFPAVARSIPGARLRLLLLPGDAAARWRTQLAGEPWADVRIGAVADLDAELAQCQVAAFPFRWPVTLTPALAAAQAMAVGLPLVATDVESLAPLVEAGTNGFLVPTHDPDALARALTAALGDAATWRHLSRGARKTIESRWSWRAAADTTREAYQIARRRSARRSLR